MKIGLRDSHSFPQPPANHSSIPNESGRGYPCYAASSAVSVTDPATEYSSAASDAGYDSMAASRTLPRPTQLLGAPIGPLAPQSMMAQFSSKRSANAQKKHKCKICDKRFSRPSSLQTHMYSHTGETPFACDVEGCGRHFSVISNLRRHKKMHNNLECPCSFEVLKDALERRLVMRLRASQEVVKAVQMNCRAKYGMLTRTLSSDRRFYGWHKLTKLLAERRKPKSTISWQRTST